MHPSLPKRDRRINIKKKRLLRRIKKFRFSRKHCFIGGNIGGRGQKILEKMEKLHNRSIKNK